MEIRIALTGRDLTAFQRYLLRHQSGTSHKSKLGPAIGLTFVATVFALALYYVEDLWKMDVLDVLIHTAVILVGLFLIAFVWQFVLAQRLARKIPGETYLRLDDDGLRYDDLITQSYTHWAGVDHIAQVKDHLFIILKNLGGYVVPRRNFSDPSGYDALLGLLRRYCPEQTVEPQTKVTATSRKRRRWVWRAVAILALPIFLMHVSPWRNSVMLPDDLGGMEYLAVETGGAAADAALPLVIELHPLGGFPEVLAALSYRRDFKARFVYPSGAHWYPIGASWFSFDHHMAETAKAAADRVAAFTTLMRQRYPTLGRPIVTGFSQGGSMAFAMAAYHPELFVAAVPVGAALPGDLPKRPEAPGIAVRGLHGAEDEIVPTDWARHTIGEMKKQGWDAALREFGGMSHRLTSEARAEWNRLLSGYAEDQAAAGQ